MRTFVQPAKPDDTPLGKELVRELVGLRAEGEEMGAGGCTKWDSGGIVAGAPGAGTSQSWSDALFRA